MSQSLDDLLASLKFNLTPPALLKIDSQGSELDILAGAKDSMPCFDVIYLEAPVVLYNHNAPDLTAYITFMSNRGYRLFDVGTHHIQRNQLIQVDVLFLRKDSVIAQSLEKVLNA